MMHLAPRIPLSLHSPKNAKASRPTTCANRCAHKPPDFLRIDPYAFFLPGVQKVLRSRSSYVALTPSRP
jgi:hypothetical protein